MKRVIEFSEIRNYITNFTHVLEALLDSMREGKVAPTRDIVDSLLKSVDVLAQMVHSANQDIRPSDSLGAEILEKLNKYATGENNGHSTEAYGLFDNEPDVSLTGEQRWRIDFTPKESLFSTGNEPLLILHELAKLGTATVLAHTDKVPALDKIIPDVCYLRWSIELVTDKPKSAIEEVFEFVVDDCTLMVELVSAKQDNAQSDMVKTKSPAASTEGTAVPDKQMKSIRVDLDKIDRLVNIVGELVIPNANEFSVFP